MVKARKLSPLPILDELSVLGFLRERGVKDVHATTIWNHIVNQRPQSIRDINIDLRSALPSGLIEALEPYFAITTSKVVTKDVASDGTTKLLVELQDGQRVETVIIKHEGRNTLCVSSQIGCQMGCTFCATGTMGIKGDLHSGEILEQLYHASAIAPIRNVVFMGMGEPLQNYDAVLAAIRGMVDVKRFSLGRGNVTLSTVGVIPKIRQLTQEAPYVSLALSLHAPNQELRAKIVPSARAWPIDKLLAASFDHLVGTKRQLLIEYVLLKGVNDLPEHAHELGELLKGKNAIINLIPYNPTDVAMGFETPDDQSVEEFFRVVATEYGLLCTIRRHHGRDIGGACGQLVLTKEEEERKQKNAAARDLARDIEDLGGVRAGTGSGSRARAVVRRRRRGGEAEDSDSGDNSTTTARGEGGEAQVASPSRDEELEHKGLPAFISCSRLTWVLSTASVLIVGLVFVLIKCGVTAYVLRSSA